MYLAEVKKNRKGPESGQRHTCKIMKINEEVEVIFENKSLQVDELCYNHKYHAHICIHFRAYGCVTTFVFKC